MIFAKYAKATLVLFGITAFMAGLALSGIVALVTTLSIGVFALAIACLSFWLKPNFWFETVAKMPTGEPIAPDSVKPNENILPQESVALSKHSQIIFKEYFQNKVKINAITLTYEFLDYSIFGEADFIVKHGAMHVSRVSLAIPIFLSLYKKYQDPDAMKMTLPELAMLQIAGLFHDTGRILKSNDIGYDNHEMESLSAKACLAYLKKAFPEQNIKIIERIAQAIENKDKDPNDIYCKLLQNADCIDVLRAHDWQFNKKYLAFYEQYKSNDAAMADLDEVLGGWKFFLNKLEDAPQAYQITPEKNAPAQYSLETKRKFEQSANCFEQIYQCMADFSILFDLYTGKALQEKPKELLVHFDLQKAGTQSAVADSPNRDAPEFVNFKLN